MTTHPRKTVDIVYLIEQVNEMLEKSVDDRTEGRDALCAVLENVLQYAEVYAGFRYLPTEFTEEARLNLREGYDNSRRQYYVHRKLVKP